jgi:predicted aspartyl protease
LNIVPSHQLSFTPSVLQKDGPRIFIQISAPSSDIKEGSPVGLEFPPPFGITAVIDTGASLTVVNPEVVEKCKLRATGFAIVASIEKKAQYRQHAAWIRFPNTKLKDLDGIPVVACKISQQPYSCLIGRDILRNWLLTYSGDGTVSIEELR